MNISYLAACSNKNLQGIAGVSFVVADKNHLESICGLKPKNFYLNLYAQYKHFSETNQMRFTPPVHTIYALKRAITELILEGIEHKYERYKKSWNTLIIGLERLGLRYLVDKEIHSKIITTIVEPDCDQYNFARMHDYFHKYGFTIYPGKLSAQNTFRVANIGGIDYEDIENFILLLEKYLLGIGYQSS